MNILEGASRMQRSGRALVIVALAAFALCAIAAGIYTFLPSSLHVTQMVNVVLPLLVGMVWICAMALALGAVLWIGGWILEGFFHHTH